MEICVKIKRSFLGYDTDCSPGLATYTKLKENHVLRFPTFTYRLNDKSHETFYIPTPNTGRTPKIPNSWVLDFY